MSETIRVVRLHETGGPEVLKIETVPLPVPGLGEVRLRVKAIGLNRAELMWREGKYLIAPVLPAKIGFEASGIIDAVGPGVDESWIGKRVSNLPAFSPNDYGVYGDAAIVPLAAVVEIPGNLSFEAGTAIWVPYLTAYGSLVRIGQLKEGDFVLITAASSSTGLAAMQLVKSEGGFVIATTRTAAKKAELFAAGADHVIVTDDEDLPSRVMSITGGVGARLVYDPIGGSGLPALAEATALNGIIFEYGLLSTEPTPYPLLTALLRRLTIRAYDAAPELFKTPEVLKEGKKYLHRKIADGSFMPHLHKDVFSLDQIAEAHRFMEKNQQFGKIIVRP
jgi:NADPH:quinone reductase-like Zn-dependent oxidoreductase